MSPRHATGADPDSLLPVTCTPACFDKPVVAASEQEFIRLAAMLKGPNQYHPSNDLVDRARRIDALLHRLCEPEAGSIRR